MRTRGGVGIDTPGAPPGATPAAAPECAPALDLIAALDRGSQLEWLRERLAESGEGRSAALDGLHLAGRAGCDPVAIAIAAWELLFGGRPGLTGKRRGELERACSVLDRLAGRKGAGTDRLLSWMFAVACDLEDQAEGAPVGIAPALGRHPAQPAPATLAYFVTRLRALARARRRAWRQARRGTAAPGSSGGGTDG